MALLWLLFGCSLTPSTDPAGSSNPQQGAPAVKENWPLRAAEQGRSEFLGTDLQVHSYFPAVPAGRAAQSGSVGQDDDAIRQELRAGRITVIETDLRGDPSAKMVGHLLDAAAAMEVLHQQQRGSFTPMREVWPKLNPIERTLATRNQGVWCEVADCSLGGWKAPRQSGLYPPELQAPEFCKTLDDALLQPFVVAKDASTAIPVVEAFPRAASQAKAALFAAAEAAPANEAALVNYLRAAASAFETNDWFAADEAWAAMNQDNSAWYLRAAPDEVYDDPCGAHGGFALTLARVNLAGKELQEALAPHKLAIEAETARLAGPPYVAREVAFELPEFIDIVVNAGDSRRARGATVGQSLPNWGPVSDAGGRTVAMTNIGTDPASLATVKDQMASLFCPNTFASFTEDPAEQLYTTVIHEALHNLGPSGSYAIDGKTARQVFGGPLASTLEELKCEITTMHLVSFLMDQGVAPPSSVYASHLSSLSYAFKKYAEGREDENGNAMAYGRLAAIEVGTFLDQGALKWLAGAPAANGKDTGCLEASADALSKEATALATRVLEIKSKGLVEPAEALIERYVAAPKGDLATVGPILEERMGRAPMPTYVYGVLLD